MKNPYLPDEPQAGPYIGILPHGFRPKGNLGQTQLNQVLWPLGAPPNIDTARIDDLDAKDHICSFPEYWLYAPRKKAAKTRLSLVIAEPKSIHGHHMRLARWFHRNFHRILTCNSDLISTIPNGHFFIYGDSWIEDWAGLDLIKTAMLSLIASKKRTETGHKLRHQVVKEMRRCGLDGDIMGRGYRAFADKAEGLAPYRFSVVIENTREPSYITEKLIDALLCKTVPIYWGAPDVGQFFDAKGMIICNSHAEIMAAVRCVSEADYSARLHAIDANQKEAARYADCLKSVAMILKKSFAT